MFCVIFVMRSSGGLTSVASDKYPLLKAKNYLPKQAMLIVIANFQGVNTLTNTHCSHKLVC